MVVDFLSMSSMNFAILDCCSLSPDTCADLCFPMSCVLVVGCMILKIGFLKQLLIHLTITVRTTTCAGERTVTVPAPESEAAGMQIACFRCPSGFSGKLSLPVDHLRHPQHAANRQDAYRRQMSPGASACRRYSGGSMACG
jgi:hypothetical protein